MAERTAEPLRCTSMLEIGHLRLELRPGRDTITGGPGNDLITARDGAKDTIDCGLGRDIVTADKGDKVARNCELVRRS